MFTLYPAVGVVAPGASMLVSVDMMGESPGYSEEVRFVQLLWWLLLWLICLVLFVIEVKLVFVLFVVVGVVFC